MISLVKNSMPQFVWWMTNHSAVPSSLWEMTSERIASSLARPPALRMTWASPSLRPAYFGRIEASVHAREDREAARGRQRQGALLTEVGRVGVVRSEDFV